MAAEAGRLGCALKLLDEAGFTDPGFTPDIDGLATAGFATRPEHRPELA